MAAKRHKPEEIVGLLRRAEALNGQGMSMADASRQPQMIRVKFYGVNRGGIMLRKKRPDPQAWPSLYRSWNLFIAEHVVLLPAPQAEKLS